MKRLALIFVWAVTLWGQSSRVDLPPRLRVWQQEIESRGGASLIPVRVFVEVRNGAPTYVLPDDTPQRPLLAQYFGDANFRAQFVRTHAVSIQLPTVSFIVLNMDRMKDMGAGEEILLSHEFGHAWLHAQGLRAPVLPPGQAGCQAIHVGDIVQHLLIRDEQTRRGFDFRPGWVRDLQAAAEKLRQQPPDTTTPIDPCLRLERLALLVDVEAGLTDGQWTGRKEFLDRLPAGDPRLKDMAGRLTRILRGYDLANATEYYLGLSTVLSASHLLFQPPNVTP